MRPSDADLVLRCRKGDVTGFEELYRLHATRIYNVAYRMCGSIADAEDLLQEIFVLVFRKLDSFKGDSALSTWLHRLAINHCLDHLRSRTAKMSRATESLDNEASWIGSPRALADSGIARLDLERAIDQLPPGCRAAFLLHDVEGFQHDEIAEMLGIAVGTSKSQVHKARVKVRAFLTRQAPCESARS